MCVQDCTQTQIKWTTIIPNQCLRMKNSYNPVKRLDCRATDSSWYAFSDSCNRPFTASKVERRIPAAKEWNNAYDNTIPKKSLLNSSMWRVLDGDNSLHQTLPHESYGYLEISILQKIIELPMGNKVHCTFIGQILGSIWHKPPVKSKNPILLYNILEGLCDRHSVSALQLYRSPTRP